MRILQQRYAKIILAILGTILLGAIGNGVWENILRPILKSVRDIALNITTFGYNSYKDDIYREIAKGFCEKPSVSLLCLAIGSFLGFALAIITSGSILRPLKASFSLEKARKIFFYVSLSYVIFVFVFGLLYSARISYINSAVTYFEQLRSVISPYVNEQEEKTLISRFSQISSKWDFKSLISEMEEEASRNNLKFSKFKVW